MRAKPPKWKISALCALLVAVLEVGTFAPRSLSESHFEANGSECVRCQTPPSNCFPDCCSSYTDIYVTNVRVVTNTTNGTYASFSWSDQPSSASNAFTWWMIGSQTNHSSNPTTTAITLWMLSPYTKYDFVIDAWKNNNYPTCYISGTDTGEFSPYYPHQATITTHVFNGSGTIKIGGVSFGNNALGIIYIPDTVSLRAMVSASFTRLNGSFGGWLATLGVIGSKYSPTTNITFWGTDTTAGLTMLLNRSTGNWAGMSVSSGSVSSVAAEFVIPSFHWTGPNGSGGGLDNCSNPIPGESTSIWLGIGSASNSSGVQGWLWQAGIVLWLNSSTSSPWVRVFAEEIPEGQSPDCQVYADKGNQFPANDNEFAVTPGPLTYQPQIGDIVDIFLQVGMCQLENSFVCGNLTIKITHDGASAYWPSDVPRGENIPLPTPTDQTTGEWIVENPSVLDPPQSPSVAPLNFTDVAVNQVYQSTSYIGWQGPYAALNLLTPPNELINISGALVQQTFYLDPLPTYLGSTAVARVQYETI